MIVAKTKLRKIPENCGKCALSRENWTGERECPHDCTQAVIKWLKSPVEERQ